MPLEELLNDRGRGLVAQGPAFAEAMRNFEFLSCREKFLAGSWNFLSYFGRDTLISLRIMWPVLSAAAKRTGIQSVANEIAENGIVNVTDEWTDDRTTANALEGFFRAWDGERPDEARGIMQTILAGDVPEHPFLDVLDQTYMISSAAAAWFRELDDRELREWLQTEHAVLGRTETNLTTLLRNWNCVLESAEPFIAAWKKLRAHHPACTPKEIIAADPDAFRETWRLLVPTVAGAANWRDTYHLPLHCRSEDINVNLLPMAIEAIREMAGRIGGLAGGPPPARRHNLDVICGYLEEPERFAAAREAWNWDLMREYFLVRRSAEEMCGNLQQYLAGLANGDVFGDDRERADRERDALLRCRADGVAVADFLGGEGIPESVKAGIEFTALLLDPEGRPVPVLQSDDVFLLLFGQPTLAQFRTVVRSLVLPYPFGLGFWDDAAGFAISNAMYSPRDNPALADNEKNMWVKFGPGEYHGRAAWPWVLFALIGGTHDQVMRGIDSAGRIADEITAADLALFESILTKAKASIARLGPLATSEVYRFAPAPDGPGTWQAEPLWISTPIQLWSAAPANGLIDDALARINLAGKP